MGLDLASAPSTDGAVSDAYGRGNLLIALLGMGIRRQNNPSTYGQRLRRRVRSDELLKVFSFFSVQFDWIGGFGTSHVLSPPTPNLSSLVDPVKLEKHFGYAEIARILPKNHNDPNLNSYTSR